MKKLKHEVHNERVLAKDEILLRKQIKFINQQMKDYVYDMELRNKYGDFEKKIVLMGEGNICFDFLKETQKQAVSIEKKL
jgi:hypothetical protein